MIDFDPVRISTKAYWVAIPFLKLLWLSSPTMTLTSIGLRLLRALAPVATLFVAKLIIDEIIVLTRLDPKPETVREWLESGRCNYLGLLIGAEFSIAVLMDAIGRAITLADYLLTQSATNLCSVQLMEHAYTIDLEKFEDAAFQNQLERAQIQVGDGMTLVGQMLGQAQDIVTIICLSVGLVAYEPWLLFFVVLALLPAFLGEAHFSAQNYLLDFDRTEERRQLDYVREVGTSGYFVKEVKLLALKQYLVELYKDLAQQYMAATRAVAIRRARWGGLFAIIGTLGYYTAYLYLAWRAVLGQLSVGDVAFLSGSFRHLNNLLEWLLVSITNTSGQLLRLGDLFSFLQIRPEIASAPYALPVPRPIVQGLEFDNVGYKYRGTEQWAVRNLKFRISAGETIALVGENGAGKTTIVKLMVRLYDPDEGSILLDGKDLRSFDLDDLRGRFSVIFQDFGCYDWSVANNIAAGNIRQRHDRSCIEKAAKRSDASSFISTLSRQYEQAVGIRFRDSVNLSGGEWQKLVLARVFMRDAEIVILDEPTAALDARSEKAVFDQLRDFSRGKITVLVSHRLSNTRFADRIIVLSDGGVEDIGPHEELMGRCDRYIDLFKIQADAYR